MKLKKTLTAFGLMAITASGVLTGPAAYAATESTEAESSVATKLQGKLTYQHPLNGGANPIYQFSGILPPERVGAEVKTQYNSSAAGAAGYAATVYLPKKGATGTVMEASSGLCIELGRSSNTSFWAECDSTNSYQRMETRYGADYVTGHGLWSASRGGWVVSFGTGTVGTSNILAKIVGIDGFAEVADPSEPVVPGVPVVESDAVPTLAPGATGAASVKLTNNAATDSARNLPFEMKAPTGTTFNSNEITWVKTGPGEGTSTATGTLSADKKTLTVAGDNWLLEAGGTMTISATLKANTENPVSGPHNDGSFRATAAGVLPINTTAALGWVSSYVAPVIPGVPTVATEAVPTLAPGATGAASVKLTNSAATDSARNLLFEMKAPTGTTFNSGTVSWVKTGTGAGSGNANGTLSADKKTVTVDGTNWILEAGGTMTLSATLKADTENPVSGPWNDGSFRATAAGVLPINTTAALGWVSSHVASEDLVVTSPAIGGDVLTGGAESVTPVFTGTATPGAEIRIEGVTGSVLGTAKAHATTGAWTIIWNKSLLPSRYVGGHTIQTLAGVELDRVQYDFTVKHAAEARPLAVTSPTVGGDVLTGGAASVKPVFTGTATPGADIRIVGVSGSVLGSTKANATGAWSIELNKSLLPERYVGGYTIQTLAGVELDRVQYDFTVKLAADILPVVLTSPAIGGEVVAESWGSARPVFTGTATPGADVRVVTAFGTNVGSVKADAVTGAWTITWTQTLLPATYRGGSVIQSIGGTDLGATAYDFAVVEAR